MSGKKWIVPCVVLAALALLAAATVNAGSQAQPTGLAPQAPLGNAFTYQGQLKRDGRPVTDNCDMVFRLYDQDTLGSQVGDAITTTVPITDGLFTVQLDFGLAAEGGAFTGDRRWLGIKVRCAGESEFADLGRRELTAVPYALYAAYASPYKRTVIVSPVGTATENGTALLNAMGSITDTSETSPYLLKIEPGVYDLITRTLYMQPYVDVEGSGESVTLITSAGSGSTTSGTVRGANNAELRFLTVQAAGSTAHTVGIYNSHASPHLTHVTVIAKGGVYDTYGIRNNTASPRMTAMTIEASASGGDNVYGVFNLDSSSPEMTDLTITASGGTSNIGLFITRSSPTLSHVTITASGGTTSQGIHTYATVGAYIVRANHSQITGDEHSIYASSYFTILVGNSQLSGGPVDDSWGTVTCAGVYDENYAFFADTCP